ncbi:phage major capsid protein [Galactobacillus timonensis]|uniref:phage major capsid protein n=1 Tax=Galactobacillus timonensis TaxID=2041840 RepID=UPI000C81C1C4|nr:phage major capsid protein [Galactobacillus timonensis]
MTLNEYQDKMKDLAARGKDAAQAGRLDEADAIKAEAEATRKAFEAEKAAAAEKAAMANTKPAAPFMAMAANTKVNMEDRTMTENMNLAATPEYRNAFLKRISGRDLNDAEKQAYEMVNADFTHTTETLAGVIPTQIADRIWNTIDETHSILDDIQTLRGTGVVMELPVHTEVKAGKAKKTAEGAANDDEQNTLATIKLAGNDYSKDVVLSYAARNMAIDALENYLVQEIGAQLADAMAADVVATVEGAIDSGNKLTSTKLAYTDITKLFGTLKRCSQKVAYVSSSTLYNQLANLTDTTGRPLFVPSVNDDAADGALLGAKVRIEDAVADGVILVGDPQRVVNNVVTDVLIESDKDIKSHTFIYSGYARAEAGLVDSKSFATLTIGG